MSKPHVPTWYWLAAIVLLLWNLGGVAAFVHQASMTPEQMAALPQAEHDAFAAMPLAIWIAYGIATIGAALGTILLLLRRKGALPLYVISLIAVIIQFGWSFGVAGIIETVGPGAAIFPAFIVFIAAMEIWFARYAIRRGWLV